MSGSARLPGDPGPGARADDPRRARAGPGSALSPNALTLIGFGIACVAAVAAGAQWWLAAGLLVVFGGVFDLFDGALARATGRVSRLGAFMDSVFDRWGEGVVYVGVAWGCLAGGFDLGAILAAAAMASAFMVSYTRAKSESLGFAAGPGMANVGLAPREVRIAILTIGLIAAALAGGVWVFDCGALLLRRRRLGGRQPVARRVSRPHRRPRDRHHHPANRPYHQPGIEAGAGVTERMEQEQQVSNNGSAPKPRGKKIRVAIVGVGNCASSLVQGRYYYENAKPGEFVPGLMHVKLGDYHISDVEFVAAFDVDKEKVGKDLSEAIFSGQNNTY